MIDILLGSPHTDIRLSVVDQLYQLRQTINTGRRGDEGRKRGEGVRRRKWVRVGKVRSRGQQGGCRLCIQGAPDTSLYRWGGRSGIVVERWRREGLWKLFERTGHH